MRIMLAEKSPPPSSKTSPVPPKSAGASECVKVVVRCRPMTLKEIRDGHTRIVEMDPSRGLVDLQNPSKLTEPRKVYTFDAVYDWNSKQTDIYDETARPLVNCVLEGFNCTIFAYGQTGTGKTYTMEGIRDDEEKKGIIPHSFDHIFNHIARTENQQYLVRSSYLEIYQEEIRDLLAKDQNKRLELKERADVGVYVKDLSSFVCKSVKEIEHVMSVGNQNRAVGATNMNEHSSRSHAIFIITVEHSEMGIDGKTHIRVGKLNLVDLAGSERQVKTGTVGQRQKEAIKINLSLSALGNVISALVDKKSTHIPYRDSKLTRLLQDSLGGNSKTVMVANVGPASYNYEESLTTLRYANRAKNIKNRPRVNEDPKDALLREFQLEIERLKQMLIEKQKKKIRGESGDTNGLSKSSSTSSNLSSIQSNGGQSVDLEAFEKLDAKIRAMESKLLTGGKNIVDHTNDQQRELETRKNEVAAQKRREREILQQLELKEENELEVRETFSSLQQEVEIKKKKLRKLFNKLQVVKGEIKDVNESNGRERRELEEIQTDLMKDLKLKYLMIDNFIPPPDKTQILNRMIYDDEEDDWKLIKMTRTKGDHFLSKRPVSDSNSHHRPICEYSRIAATVGPTFRYKGEDILDIELIMPIRSTKDYHAPLLSPRVRAALDSALKTEEEVSIDASALDSFSSCDPLETMVKKARAKTAAGYKNGMIRPKTGMKRSGTDSSGLSNKSSNGSSSNGNSENYPQIIRPDTASHFPTSRGLVHQKR